jgi:hypothetical protein
MKNSLFAVALVFASASTTAFAGDRPSILPDYNAIEGYTSVSCRDARPMVDAGIQVKITERAGAKVLELSEESFAGPRALGSVPVRQVFTQQRGNHDVFLNTSVQLVIDLDSAQTPDVNNNGELQAYVRGTVGTVRVDNDVRCKFFSRLH